MKETIKHAMRSVVPDDEAKYKLITRLGLGIVLTAWLMMLYVAYLSMWPYNPLEIYNVTILGGPFHPGEKVSYVVDYCKYMDMSAETFTSFQNDIIYNMPAKRTNVPIGCHSGIVSIGIPSELPPDNYTIVRKMVYRVNKFRDISIESSSTVLEVLPNGIHNN